MPLAKSWRKHIVNFLKEDPDEALNLMSEVCDGIEETPLPNQFWPRIGRAAKIGAVLVGGWLALDALDVTDNVAKALRGDPLQYNRLTVVTPIIRPNEPLKLHISTLRRRMCAWNWDLFWEQVTPDGDVLVARTEDRGGSLYKMDEATEYTVSILTPRDLPDGTYKLTSIAKATCSHGDVFEETNQPVMFKVAG